MIADADDLDDGHLFSVAADLAKQFEKVMLKIKKRDCAKTAAESAAVVAAAAAAATAATIPPNMPNISIRQQCQQLMYGDTSFSNASACKAASCTCSSRQMQKQQPQSQPQPQLLSQQQQQKMPQQHQHQQHQQPQPVFLAPATNESNFAAVSAMFDQRIRTEPNELKLILKLDTWLDDSGSLVVKPSVYEDRGDAADKAAAAAAAAAVAVPVAVSLVKTNSAEDNSQPAAVAIVPPGKLKAKNLQQQQHQQQQKQQQQQQQQPGGKRLRSYLNNSVQEIAHHLQGAINSGSISGSNTRRPPGGGASDQAKRRQSDFQAYHSGGDGCQVNNHHDSVSENLSDNSDANSFDSDADSYRRNPVGAGVPVGVDKPAAHAAVMQPGDQTIGNTRELIERLQELIKNDPNAALEY